MCIKRPRADYKFEQGMIKKIGDPEHFCLMLLIPIALSCELRFTRLLHFSYNEIPSIPRFTSCSNKSSRTSSNNWWRPKTENFLNSEQRRHRLCTGVGIAAIAKMTMIMVGASVEPAGHYFEVLICAAITVNKCSLIQGMVVLRRVDEMSRGADPDI